MGIRSMNLFKFLFNKKDEEKIPIDSVFDEKIELLTIKSLFVHIAISYIADTISKCNFNFYENGELKKFSKEDYIFNIGPNVNMSAPTLKRDLIFKLFLDGEALIFDNKGSLYLADNFFREQYPLKEDRFKNISIKQEINTFDKNASEVFYFTLKNNSVTDLIDSMYIELQELLSYAIKNYKSSISEKYKLKIEQSKIGDPQFMSDYENFIKKQLKTFIENPKSVYPEFKGYNLESLKSNTNKTDSSDILNLKKDILETVTMAFKMPTSLLYGNMTNVKDIFNSYLTLVIDPVKELIEKEITKKQNSMDSYANKNYCIVDTSKISHIDLFDVADKIDKLVASGYACIDEIRERVGDQPLNNKFSHQHWMTKNYAKIEELLSDMSTIMKGGE